MVVGFGVVRDVGGAEAGVFGAAAATCCACACTCGGGRTGRKSERLTVVGLEDLAFGAEAGAGFCHACCVRILWESRGGWEDGSAIEKSSCSICVHKVQGDVHHGLACESASLGL